MKSSLSVTITTIPGNSFLSFVDTILNCQQSFNRFYKRRVIVLHEAKVFLSRPPPNGLHTRMLHNLHFGSKQIRMVYKIKIIFIIYNLNYYRCLITFKLKCLSAPYLGLSLTVQNRLLR